MHWLQEEVESKDTQLLQKDGQLQEKDEQLRQKDSQLQEKDRQLQEKDGQTQHQRTELQETATPASRQQRVRNTGGSCLCIMRVSGAAPKLPRHS